MEILGTKAPIWPITILVGLSITGLSCSATISPAVDCPRWVPDVLPAAPPTSTYPVQVAPQLSYSCARMSDGSVRCRGSNFYGNLAMSNFAFSTRDPITVPGLQDVSSVQCNAVGTVCALTVHGGVWCWGNNVNGLVGNGHRNDTSCSESASRPCVSTPTQVEGVGDVVKLTLATNMACALRRDHHVMCWGEVRLPGLTSEASYARALLVPAIDNAIDIFPAARSMGILLATGEVVSSEASARVRVRPEIRINSNTVGEGRFCYVDIDRSLWCWGNNAYDIVASGASSLDPVGGPRKLDISCVVDVAVSAFHACALTTTGTVFCWGANQHGECGSSAEHDVPCGYPSQGSHCTAGMVPVEGLDRVVSIAAESFRTCAIRDDSTVWCWGVLNGADSHVPARVEW